MRKHHLFPRGVGVVCDSIYSLTLAQNLIFLETLKTMESTPRTIPIALSVGIAIVITLLCWYYIHQFTFSKPDQSTNTARTASACPHGVRALWNDLGPTHQQMCCRSASLLVHWGTVWCKDMIEGDTCMFDEQCMSQHCNPGMTAESTCATKPHHSVNWHDVEGRRPPFVHHKTTSLLVG